MDMAGRGNHIVFCLTKVRCSEMFSLFLLAIVLVSGVCTDTDFTVSNEGQGSFNRYYVYSREYHRHGYELMHSEASINDSPIIKSRDTAIIVHGHQGSAFNSLNPVVKDAFLTSHDLNIIVVDWSMYAQQSYRNAVIAVPSVGISLANLITSLVEGEKIELDRLHIVGFDLGAHVAGFTGRTLAGQVARITGLDPSRNQWESNSHRLTHTDALYVEVIHTDGDGLKSNGLGTAIGHTDFFPNGGSKQPGCFFSNTCSHNRAWELFAATVIYDHLIANRCANTLQMLTNNCHGYILSMGNNQYVKLGTGIFRVNTRRSFPF